MKNIFRIDKANNPFAQIDRRIFENPKLSWKAKGLLGYLLSRPDDWRVVMGDLVKRSTDGEEAVRTALGELQRVGHVRREPLRAADGTLEGTRWIISEAEIPVGEQTEMTEMAVFPSSVKPDAVNPPLNNKEGNDKNSSPPILRKEDKTSLEAVGFVEAFLKLLEKTGARITPPTPSARAKWAKTYDDLVRLDGKTKEEIWRVCLWARNSPFWKSNFMSPAKLREKKDGVSYYDRLYNQMMNPRETNSKSSSRALGDNSNIDALAEYEKRLAASG